jgi:hypothetical protein
VLAILAAGCPKPEDIRDAINAINKAFQTEYERILKERGTRVIGVGRNDALDAMRVTMLRLGMRVTDQNPALGYLSVSGPAPKPLDLPEWRQAEKADLPRARDIIREHLGPIAAELFTFEPEGLEIVMNVTIIATGAVTSEVSLTMRMWETTPPKSNLPRREYPPPTAVRMGLDKIWTRFDQELRTARRP